MKRRVLLQGAGVVAVLAAGGAAWRAYDRGVFSIGEGPAYEPWRDWRTDDVAGSLAVVRAAILAASPHNTKPWLFKIAREGIELYADTRRNLGTFDPYLREMHIGLGCALENLAIAAAAGGSSAAVTLLPGELGPIPPEPAPRLVARISLTPAARQENGLYHAIPMRHTNRGPYDLKHPIPPELLANLEPLTAVDPAVQLFLFTKADALDPLRAILIAATETITGDAQMIADSERWSR